MSLSRRPLTLHACSCNGESRNPSGIVVHAALCQSASGCSTVLDGIAVVAVAGAVPVVGGRGLGGRLTSKVGCSAQRGGGGQIQALGGRSGPNSGRPLLRISARFFGPPHKGPHRVGPRSAHYSSARVRDVRASVVASSCPRASDSLFRPPRQPHDL